LAVAEVVKNGNFMACVDQFNTGMRSNVARAASDKNHA
jgi:hypothetical protein